MIKREKTWEWSVYLVNVVFISKFMPLDQRFLHVELRFVHTRKPYIQVNIIILTSESKGFIIYSEKLVEMFMRILCLVSYYTSYIDRFCHLQLTDLRYLFIWILQYELYEDKKISLVFKINFINMQSRTNIDQFRSSIITELS